MNHRYFPMSSENASSINKHPNHSQTRSEAASPSTSFFTPPRPRPHPKYHYIHSADGTVTQKKLRPRTSSPHVVSRLLSFNASSVFMRRMVEEQHLQRSTKSDTNESNPSSSTKSSTSPSTLSSTALSTSLNILWRTPSSAPSSASSRCIMFEFD